MIGRVIYNYRIEELIGEGGMGTVYRAVDIVLGRDVALKMLHPQLISQSSFFERFKNEAQILARLNHPNIAILHNFIEDGGDYFMVMEFIEGEDFEKRLKREKYIEVEQALIYARKTLSGLTHAHQRGVFHRDIKPANLILTPDEQVKIMDFGIAKAVGGEKLTQVNRLVGTLEYIAPELLKGADPSVQSDLYAFGVVLYEMLSGDLPFQAKTDYDLMEQIIHQKPISLKSTSATISPDLVRVIDKLLQKKPAQRYSSAKEVLEALQSVDAVTKDSEVPKRFLLPDFTVKIPALTFPGLAVLKITRTAKIISASVLVAILLLVFIPKNQKEAKPEISETEEAFDSAAKIEIESSNPSSVPLQSEIQNPTQKPDLIVEIPNEVQSKKTPSRKQEPERKSVKMEKTDPPAEKKREESQNVKMNLPKVEEVAKPLPEPKKESLAPRKVTLSGQKVIVELTSKLSSEKVNEGASIGLLVSKDLIINGIVVFKKGATAKGKVTDLRKATAFRKELLEIRITEVKAANGEWVEIKAAVFRQVAKSSNMPVEFNQGQQFITETSYTTLEF